MTDADLRAPFPWFGGKSRAVKLVWPRLGEVTNYVEPFFGSGAMLLGSPRIHRMETVNDRDGFVANFWRALAADPEAVAHWADQPVVENDLHARHSWLVSQVGELVPRLEGDPDYYDAKIAGWWVWGLCCWISGGWCAGKGPWRVVDGQLVKGTTGQGVRRKIPHLGDTGRGVNRQMPHLGCGEGVNRISLDGGLVNYLCGLANRIRRVRVCCGDWRRVLGPAPTTCLGLTAVFLDPPYSRSERDANIYRVEADIATDVRTWAAEHGQDPQLRIALCGYDTEHADLESIGWEVVRWSAHGGYCGPAGNGRASTNRHRERIWFSPSCIQPKPERQLELW